MLSKSEVIDIREEVLHDLYYDLSRAAAELNCSSLRGDEKEFYGHVGNLFRRALANHKPAPTERGDEGRKVRVLECCSRCPQNKSCLYPWNCADRKAALGGGGK